MTLVFSAEMKLPQSGGQLHGIKVPVGPWQFPCPSGFVPAVQPKGGTLETSMSRLMICGWEGRERAGMARSKVVSTWEYILSLDFAKINR